MKNGPWGYKQSVVIGITLLLVGVALQILVGNQFKINLQWPFNFIAFSIHIVICIFFFLFFKTSVFIRWITKVPASIVAIVMVLFLTMLVGTIPQTAGKTDPLIEMLGLNKITQTWYFLLIVFFFSTCLLMICIKRISLGFFSNLGFLANHLGLYIALNAGIFGSSDLIRYTMELKENKISWVANDANNKAVVMPLAIVLEDFEMEEFPPKLAIINQKGDLLTKKGKNLYLVKKDLKVELENNYKVEVADYLPEAVQFESKYRPVNEEGATPAVYVKVSNDTKGFKSEGWLASGTFLYDQKHIGLEKHQYLILTKPEPKKFSSKIKIFTVDKEEFQTTLEVNKPFEVMGWKLYQLSYDDRFGKYSTTSTIELVKDPWLPVVYLGVFMMISGAVYLFFIGSIKSKKND
jgi:cytochrome c biogenesis protein ResB